MDVVNKLIKEIEDGVKQSINAVKARVTLVVEKADELTEEGKKQYRLYELKHKRQGQFSDLGEKLHGLVAGKKLKIAHRELKTLISSIDKTNTEIAKLEDKTPTAPGRKAAGRRAAAKPKTAAKKKTAPRRAE